MSILGLNFRVGIEDNATGPMESISSGVIAKGQMMANGLSAAVSAAKQAIEAVVGGAFDAYKQYEQLSGGIETFFGNASSAVISNAKEAYKTAGMSANQYMETVSSFATTLVNSVAKRNAQASDDSKQNLQAMVSAAESSYAALQTALQKGIDAQQKANERYNRELSRSLSDELEAQQEANAELLEARREQYADALEALKDSMQKEVDAYQQATDKKIDEINREYMERLKLIDEDEYKRVKAIEEEIKALEDEGKAADEHAKQRERAAKLAAAKEKEANAVAYDDIMAARKELSELTTKYAEEDAEAERKTKIEKLKEQKQDIRDAADEQREAVKTEQEKAVNDYATSRNEELQKLKESNEQKLEEQQKYYDNEIKEFQKAQAKQLKEQQRANEDLLYNVKEEQQAEIESMRESMNAQLAERKAGIDAQKQLLAEAMDASSGYVKATDEDMAEAAEIADRAIVDMADNANKMGTSMESIQYAYQGFAKQNFTMLDNLKLGYSGTKEGMEDLIADAERISAANGEMRDLSIESFADIVDAIHIVQTEFGVSGYSVDELSQKLEEQSLTEQELHRISQDLYSAKSEQYKSEEEAYAEVVQAYKDGSLEVQDALILTGTTSYEASQTIEGSMNSAKAAWENWLLALADPETDLGEATQQLIDSIMVAAENVIPRVEEIVARLGEAILGLIPPEFQSTIDDAEEHLNKLAEAWAPVREGAERIANIVFPKLKEVFDYVWNNSITKGLLPAFEHLGAAIAKLIGAFEFWVEPIMNVAGILMNAFFGAMSIAIEIITAAINIIADILNCLKDFSNGLENVGRDIGRFVEDAGKFFEDLRKGAERKIDEVVTFFRELPQNITNAVSNFGTLLFGAGQDLIGGLIKGIWDAGDWLWKTLGDLADSAINTVKSWFGIASPSKVMRGIGENIGEGLNEGLKSEFGKIASTVDDMNQLVNIGGTVGLTAGAYNYSTYDGIAPINIYMTYNAGEDARELVTDMVGQLRRYGYTMGRR